MNVLILTPDAVGSTLLQRLLTVYMQLQNFGKPIINLHELTNGLTSYYSDVFNQKVLGKPREWNYYQSLNEITELLLSVDHWSTSRLAKYHLDRRGDSLEQQIPFFNNLNENFFIIATRRKNVFEHAVSWCINSFTKKLNVYDAGEKIETFLEFYKDPIDIDTRLLQNYLESYKNYITWSDQYFNVGSYFCYEEHLPNIENFILNLPFFKGTDKVGWQETFGIDFQTWNKVHHTTSDLEYMAVNNPEQLLTISSAASNLKLFNTVHPTNQLISDYNNVKTELWPTINGWEDFENLPDRIKRECKEQHQLASIQKRDVVANFINQLDEPSKEFIHQNNTGYKNACSAISQMVNLGVLIGGLPIKKQTLAGKKAMIKNWQECIDTYNTWIDKNPSLGTFIDRHVEDYLIETENKIWSFTNNIKQLTGNGT